MIRRLLRTLTTDVDGLRARIAYLEGENGRLADERDRWRRDFESEAAAHSKSIDDLDELEAENGRLLALAGNMAATPAEAALLDVVRVNPGRTAPEYGRLVMGTEKPAHWREEFGPWPNSDMVGRESKPLTSLHRKGLVRREKAGQTYRYWPTERA